MSGRLQGRKAAENDEKPPDHTAISTGKREAGKCKCEVFYRVSRTRHLQKGTILILGGKRQMKAHKQLIQKQFAFWRFQLKMFAHHTKKITRLDPI